MAVDDIDRLRDQLPELFQPHPHGEIFPDDHVLIPVEDPDRGDVLESDLSAVPDKSHIAPVAPSGQTPGFRLDRSRPPPVSTGLGVFGGRYRPQDPEEPVPPPDAMAFYLPFHFFHPRWWGIYLVEEAIREFGDWISRESGGQLSRAEGFIVARLFAYGHEAFHHGVEAFATRLEVAHRKPLYRVGFTALYARVIGSDDCTEEALANAAGLRKVAEKAFKSPDQPQLRRRAIEVLHRYVAMCPPGYRLGTRFVPDAPFLKGRNDFAELNLRESVPTTPGRDAGIWSTFPHAFSGIARVTSRVNYVVPRDSSIAQRSPLALRYLRHRDVRRKLERLAGCKFVRHDGPHEIWENASGHRFPVPNHRGDLANGTLAKIIKQAGLEMSVREFMSE